METLIIVIVLAVVVFLLFSRPNKNKTKGKLVEDVAGKDMRKYNLLKLDESESKFENIYAISIDDIDKTCITKKMLEQIEKGDFFNAKLKALDLFNKKLDTIHDKYDRTHDANEDEESLGNIDVSQAYPYAQNFINLSLISYQKMLGSNKFSISLSTKNICGCIKTELDEKKISYNDFIMTRPIPCMKDCPARYNEYSCCLRMLEIPD